MPDGQGGVVVGDPTSDPRNAKDNSHAKQIFVGENSCGAMTILHQTPWNQYCVIRSSDGGPVWGSDYYSNLLLWAVPVTLLACDVGTFASDDPLIARILERAARRADHSAPPKTANERPEKP